eukprot:193264-Alexandrium_andersonii.AAC.1
MEERANGIATGTHSHARTFMVWFGKLARARSLERKLRHLSMRHTDRDRLRISRWQDRLRRTRLDMLALDWCGTYQKPREPHAVGKHKLDGPLQPQPIKKQKKLVRIS